MKNIFLVLLLLLTLMPMAVAVDFGEGINDGDKATFDQILEPLMKIYNFIKYAATMVGVLRFVFAGIIFVTAGGEQAKKDKAKHMAMGVVIGLVLIWVAPLIVNYLTQ